VAILETAGEGGPWGIALLASYMVNGQEKSLEQYLSEHVFLEEDGTVIKPDTAEVAGFERFLQIYRNMLPVEKLAVDTMQL